MTAIDDVLDLRAHSRPPAGSASSAQRRLEALLRDSGGAGWWVEMIRQLDVLADAVRTAPGNLVDPLGFTEQLRSDAPHLVRRWARMAPERDALVGQVEQVRLLAAREAADPAAVPAVSAAVRSLLTRVRRFQERTTELLLDAYQRDLGGDSG